MLVNRLQSMFLLLTKKFPSGFGPNHNFIFPAWIFLSPLGCIGTISWEFYTFKISGICILLLWMWPINSATPGKTKHFQTLFCGSDREIMLCDCPGLGTSFFMARRLCISRVHAVKLWCLRGWLSHGSFDSGQRADSKYSYGCLIVIFIWLSLDSGCRFSLRMTIFEQTIGIFEISSFSRIEWAMGCSSS